MLCGAYSSNGMAMVEWEGWGVERSGYFHPEVPLGYNLWEVLKPKIDSTKLNLQISIILYMLDLLYNKK